jgi:DNA polymerase-3 subunit epsilon
LDFIALDVETANPDLSSICQIGLVEFRNGQIINSWEWLVDPQDYFDEMNVFIHGIDKNTIRCSGLQSKTPKPAISVIFNQE